MAARLFGTDGVRGISNKDLDCNLAFKLGQAGAAALTRAIHVPRILIGRDTRISGEMLESAMVAGICSVGGEAVVLGVLPTPAIAYLSRIYGADAAVMISASHNSFEYNGIKFFNGNGFKLSDELEDKIEVLTKKPDKLNLPTGEHVGRRITLNHSTLEYVKFLSGLGEKIDGLKIVLDCAHGAASNVAVQVFQKLGAIVFPYYNTPDGSNINEHCGSTHPDKIRQLVVECEADIGLAFDGDADRLIAVDEHGVVVDGDCIMAICAIDMKSRGALNKDTLVATVMSNLGLELAMRKHNIALIRTAVGDRYVLEEMLKHDYNLGGEQSGHLIFMDSSTTGDGILSGIMLCNVMARTGKTLSELARAIEIFPQVLINVKVRDTQKYKENEQVLSRMAEIEKILKGRGRLLIRASGTEPLVRIMLEGDNQDEIENFAVELKELIQKA